jgi:hypothetical protein
MNANRDRSFQPRMESLEDRCLLSAARLLFRPGLPHHSLFAGPVGGGTGTPGAIHIATNPNSTARVTVPIAARDDSPVGLSTRGTTTIGGSDPGFVGPGLPSSSAFAHDPGLTTSGLPSFAPSQPVTPGPIQPGGLVLHPDGTVTGSLFG